MFKINKFRLLKILKLIGIMYGLIFFKIEPNQEGIMNVNAFIFLSVIYVCVIYLFTEVKV